MQRPVVVLLVLFCPFFMSMLLLCCCYHTIVGTSLLMFLIKCYCVLSQCCGYKIIDCYAIRCVTKSFVLWGLYMHLLVMSLYLKWVSVYS
jgi:hypothetical protein